MDHESSGLIERVEKLVADMSEEGKQEIFNTITSNKGMRDHVLKILYTMHLAFKDDQK